MMRTTHLAQTDFLSTLEASAIIHMTMETFGVGGETAGEDSSPASRDLNRKTDPS